MSSNSSRELIAVFLLLTIYWLIAISGSIRKTNAYDEMAHLTGGYSYLHTGDYRIHPENGVLPQKFAALPLLFLGVHFPSLETESWQHVNLWRFGFQFLFLSDNDADRMLFAGRCMIALLGVALGLTVFLWSSKLFGKKGGLISLILFVFCPSMLAHGSLVTSDLASALFLTLSVWSFWNLLNDFRWWRTVLAGAAIAALMLSKTTWILLVPILPLLILVRVMRKRFTSNNEGQSPVPLKYILGSGALICVVVYFLIWSFYSFRYSAFAANHADRNQFMFTWEQVETHSAKSAVEFVRQHRLLPEAWILGFSQVLASTNKQNRLAFLNGNYSLIGWWYFFPYAFLVKTPLPVLVILLLSLFLWWRQKEKSPGLYQTAPLWILLIVYWIFAITSKFNLGHRYILPVYPVLHILAGRAAFAWKEKSYIPKLVVILSLVWLLIESHSIRPNYLAYFNQLSGGPSNGYRHLVDSSLDWGQDLPGLQDWLTDHKDHMPVYLSYFGTSSPEYYGIKAISLLDWTPTTGPLPELHAGTYCISATMLQCMYNVPVAHWCVPYEEEYQRLLKSHSSEIDARRLQRYRFARLAAFLRTRNYDAQVGHSILIYRLTEADVKQALDGTPAELHPKIEVRGLKNGRIPSFIEGR